MFIEPHHPARKRGWVEVIAGCMFSGKTEELIRRLKRARIAGLQVEIFKPAMDTRYSENDVVSHDDSRIRSTAVSHAHNILLMSGGMDVVGIDEAQFFDEGVVDVVQELTRQGIRVIVAGLDMDYTGKPFGPMPSLMAGAEYVTKLHAICMQCGDIASYSYRIARIDDRILLGEKDVYEPRCRHCYYNV